ncbi:hypothetical protein, partial [Pseudomonas viridiflava]|uniref:hypothetical protein n=1 Tax=Pseudomonas viridiflava TaxID=33069 RepID=UPI00197FC793
RGGRAEQGSKSSVLLYPVSLLSTKGALVRKPVTGAIVMLEINGRKGFGTLQAQAFSEDKNQGEMHLPLDDGTALVRGHLTATCADWF